MRRHASLHFDPEALPGSAAAHHAVKFAEPGDAASSSSPRRKQPAKAKPRPALKAAASSFSRSGTRESHREGQGHHMSRAASKEMCRASCMKTDRQHSWRESSKDKASGSRPSSKEATGTPRHHGGGGGAAAAERFMGREEPPSASTGRGTHRFTLTEGAISERGGAGHQQEVEPPEHEAQHAAGREHSHEELWASVFKKLRDEGDGEVHRDTLHMALTLIGFIAPDTSLIDEVYDATTSYSSLSLEDFIKFVQNFDVRQEEAHQEAFERFDDDRSGYVDVTELAALLKSFGIEPMRHVLREVIKEVDEDGQGTLDFSEFKNVMALIKSREGFTRKDYMDTMEVYRRFDHDGSGEIDTKELLGILSWLGYAIEAAEVHHIVQEVDMDRSGSINEREFLLCMRMVRDDEVQKVSRLILEHDDEGDGHLETSEIEAILRAMGYVPDDDAVAEAIRDAGFVPGDSLDLSMFWQVLEVYRGREGFSAAEVHQISQAMQLYDTTGEGEISVLEVGRLLRSLGYALPVTELQSLVARVDVDGSGKLDLGEIRKLVRMHREKQVHGLLDVFNSHCAQLRRESINQSHVTMALHELRLLDPQDKQLVLISAADVAHLTPSSEGSCEVDLKGFVRIFTRVSRAVRERNRIQCGFSSKEVAELRELFQHYDLDGGGDIKAKEQVKLIEDYFPEMAHDKHMRPQLLKIMDDVDSDKSGSLDFHDYLRLLQRLCEMQDQAKLTKEQQVIKETSFSVQEVQGFRELFLASDDGSGELSLSEVRKMINTITPVGDKYFEELKSIFRELARDQRAVEGHTDQLDFPEFLRLVQLLLDRNFANIRDKTSKAGVFL